MPVIMYSEKLWRRVSKSKLSRFGDVDPGRDCVLGSWSAKLVILRRRPYALFVNQKTLMCVVLRLAPAKTLFRRFPDALAKELGRLGVGAESIRNELDAVVSAKSAKNADRSLTGSANDLAFQLEAISESVRWLGDEPDYVAVHAALNTVPHTKREPAFADQAVRALFGVPEPTRSSHLTDLATRRVNRLLAEFCDRVPHHVRDRLRHSYRVVGTKVTLLEERPAFDDPNKWIELPVAQFRADEGTGYWRLYCSDRDGHWQLYMRVPATPNLEKLLEEVRRDPTGIFWG